MRKIFTDFPIIGDFELSAADARHVVVVLRHTIGDMLPVTDSTGTTYECCITGMENHGARLTPVRKVQEKEETPGDVILAAGLLKNDKFDWVIQKATELGVTTIVPVQMDHCVVKLNDTRKQSRKDRWQRIALEAAKQCGRSDVPTVADVQTIASLVAAYGNMRFLVPYERETAPLRAACHDVRHGDVVLVIGPEGGFAPSEIDYLQQTLGWCHTVSLGPRILRAETAALAALSIVMYERGFNECQP